MTKKAYYIVNRQKCIEYSKAYYEEHREQSAKKKHEYYLDNADYFCALEKARRQVNKKEKAIQDRLYAQTHPEVRRAIHKRWVERHKEKYRRYQCLKAQRRITRKRNLLADLTVQQWELICNSFDNKCAYCGDPIKTLARDHFIPLSKQGAFTASNIVPACRECNSRKSDKDPKDWLSKKKYNEIKRLINNALKAIAMQEREELAV